MPCRYGLLLLVLLLLCPADAEQFIFLCRNDFSGCILVKHLTLTDTAVEVADPAHSE